MLSNIFNSIPQLLIVLAPAIGVFVVGRVSLAGYTTTQPTTRKVMAKSPASQTAFFTEGTGPYSDAFRDLTALLSEKALNSDDYPYVAEGFIYFTKRILRPEWLPSDQYIYDHLRLYPATKDHPEDRAFISYQIDRMSILIGETGGVTGRMVLLVSDDSISSPTGKDANASKSIVASLSKFLLHVPASDMLETKMGHPLASRFKDKPSPGVKFFGGFRTVVGKHELGASYDNYELLPGLPAAHAPMPNEWFKYEKERQLGQ